MHLSCAVEHTIIICSLNVVVNHLGNQIILVLHNLSNAHTQKEAKSESGVITVQDHTARLYAIVYELLRYLGNDIWTRTQEVNEISGHSLGMFRLVVVSRPFCIYRTDLTILYDSSTPHCADSKPDRDLYEPL